jgi:hypothetical protein
MLPRATALGLALAWIGDAFSQTQKFQSARRLLEVSCRHQGIEDCRAAPADPG